MYELKTCKEVVHYLLLVCDFWAWSIVFEVTIPGDFFYSSPFRNQRTHPAANSPSEQAQHASKH